MRSTFLGPLTALALSMFLVPTASATDYDVYFLGGQSNMVGFGVVDELPAEARGPVERAVIFHGNAAPDETPVDGRGVWARLGPGHGAGYSSDGATESCSDRFGPELYFARTLAGLEPATHIAVIKYARSGSSIDCAAAGSFGCWDPDSPDRGALGVNQYDHFLATLRNAFAARDIDNDGTVDTLRPAGIVWMQGETDAYHSQETAGRYEANLRRLIDLIRAALRVDDLPVVIGRISDSGMDETEQDGKVWNYGEIVRQAQASCVAADPRAALVTSTDSYDYSDPWHYNTAGYLDFGTQLATAMHGLRTSTEPEAAPETTEGGEGDIKSPDLRGKVEAVERAFARTMADRSLDAFDSYVSEEAVFLSGSGVLRGKHEVTERWAAFFNGPQTPFSWEPEAVEVLGSGTLALSTGPVRDAEGTMIGTFTSIWRQEEPGVWRIIFDRGNPACSQGEGSVKNDHVP